MEKNLFAKHLLTINKRRSSKEEIILLIKEKTGIVLDEEDFIISKKEIILQVSSVKKNKLVQKRVSDLVKQKGYSIK